MILAIDQGTTSSSCVVFDQGMRAIGRASAELPQSFPKPGWVEHDAGEIWRLTRELAQRALDAAGLSAGELLAIGLTNQRETVCAWDRDTARPLCNAIVWQDRRTAPHCERLRSEGLQSLVRERTGLLLDPYFSATKLAWMLHHVAGLRERVQRGTALLGTIDSWLMFNLTGEHITDVTNASRTLLFDIERRCWDQQLLDLFQIPAEALPEVRASAGLLGRVREGALHRCAGTPVTGLAGDQQAALLAQGCLHPSIAKATYGTGVFVLVNVGTERPRPVDGLIGTVALQVGGALTYAYEASVFAAGAAVQWLRDGLEVIQSASETEALAASLPSNEGVYFVPALTGLGSPHWDPHARGTIVGLTRGSGRRHLVRATLEAIAYQTADALEAIQDACGQQVEELRADGGGSDNRWLMQFQADILGVPVRVAGGPEATARGAALLAGVGAGLWGVEHAASTWREQARYQPRIDPSARSHLLEGWRDALSRAAGGAASSR